MTPTLKSGHSRVTSPWSDRLCLPASDWRIHVDGARKQLTDLLETIRPSRRDVLKRLTRRAVSSQSRHRATPADP